MNISARGWSGCAVRRRSSRAGQKGAWCRPLMAGMVLTFGLMAVGPAATAGASPAPTPTIYSATNLSNSAATLSGSVNPGGTITSLTFCYSTSAITIGGSSCTVSSGTIGYATATASPSSSSAAITFSAYATNLSAGTTYYYAAGASQTAGSTSWSATTTFKTMTGAPFVCTPNFYEETGNYLWQFNAVTRQFVAVNSTLQPTNLNPIGYDTVNNYIYGIGGTTIYQIGADGDETAIGAPTYSSGTSGDFIPGTNYLVSENGSGGAFDMDDVLSTSPASAVKPASVILGTTAGSASFAGNDFSLTYVRALSQYIGYGLKMTGTNTATLSKMVIPQSVIYANANSTAWASLPSGTIANAVTVTQVTGISFPASYIPINSDSFGSTYSDSAGDVFFLANTAKNARGHGCPAGHGAGLHARLRSQCFVQWQRLRRGGLFGGVEPVRRSHPRGRHLHRGSGPDPDGQRLRDPWFAGQRPDHLRGDRDHGYHDAGAYQLGHR